MKGKKTGGRAKGTPNRLTTSVKEMILAALNSVGGIAYLAEQARINPEAFLSLLGRLIPIEAKVDSVTHGPAPTIVLTWDNGTPPLPGQTTVHMPHNHRDDTMLHAQGIEPPRPAADALAAPEPAAQAAAPLPPPPMMVEKKSIRWHEPMARNASFTVPKNL